ncbi:MAG: hypothetical protein H6Q85_1344 [candidate division NC10 bacterium]|nr:hypothetical protein [candidate division NC10 bacterium]
MHPRRVTTGATVKNHGLVTMKLKSALEASVWNINPLPEGGTCAQILVGLFVPTGRTRHGFAPARVSTEQSSAASGV